MTAYSTKRFLLVLLGVLALSLQPHAWADDLDEIRFGEAARTFAAGSIRPSTPQDGVVNVITGDNQTVGNRMRLGQNDVFYLKLTHPGDVAVGELFTVFKRTRKVFHPATGQYMGELVNRLAIVQVVQVDKVLTTARALRSYAPVSPGDPVVRFSLPAPAEVAPAPSAGNVSGIVVEFQADMGMTLVAQRNIVYLDRGLEDGLRPGDRMEVVRYGGGLPSRTVGEVKVLSTEARTATALVTKSTSRILKGDRFQMKAQVAEPVLLPASEPAGQSLNSLPSSSDNISGKIQVQNTARETRYSLSDLMRQLHYDSGDATIKPEGYQVLDYLVKLLKAAPPEQLIRVEGHADNIEIGPSLKSVYQTNWDLSKARAGGVLRYLVEKGGIDSARITSVGYGDTKPVANNATEAGRQQNRRVDIVLYSPESAQARTEQIMKPREYYVDGGYRASGPRSDDRNPSIPGVEASVPAGPIERGNSASDLAGSGPDAITVAGDHAGLEPKDQPLPPQ